jgi:predicted phosphoribosyltransferase
MWNRAPFKNRRDAGRKLSARLSADVDGPIVVIGLPRGGVVVGFEVARALNAPLEVVVALKIPAPAQPELAIGAVAEGGIGLIDDDAVRQIGLSPAEVEDATAGARKDMNRRLQEYRGNDALPDLRGKTAILVDDGLATGLTSCAAVRAVRGTNPDAIVLAVPVCAQKSSERLLEEFDRVVCLERPPRLIAVSIWYRQFDQTTDAEVIELLEEARNAVSPKEISET